MNKTFVGIDIASKKMDVYIDTIDKHLTLERSQEGVDQLNHYLTSLDVQLIVLESTGGYESYVACALDTLGYLVSITNPKKIRNYARALGKLAKTDKIDAQILSSFARHVQPDQTQLISKEQMKLKKLIRRRKDFFCQFIPVLNPVFYWLQLIPGTTVLKKILKRREYLVLNTGSSGISFFLNGLSTITARSY